MPEILLSPLKFTFFLQKKTSAKHLSMTNRTIITQQEELFIL